MGIVCSCIPVSFTLFKNAKENSSSWASRIWYHFPGGYRKATGPSDAGNEQMPSPPYRQTRDDGTLPKVPRATITGLRSFLGRVGHTKAQRSQTSEYEEELNLTIVSADYDYHQQLRAGSMDKRPR